MKIFCNYSINGLPSLGGYYLGPPKVYSDWPEESDPSENLYTYQLWKIWLILEQTLTSRKIKWMLGYSI